MARETKPAASSPARPPLLRRGATRAILGGILVAGLFLGWRAVERRSGAVRCLPPRPVALAAHPVLLPYVEAAEGAAQSYRSPLDGLARLGRIYQANGYLAEASQVWEGLYRLDSGNPRWPYLLATILSGYGRLDESLPLLRGTVELAPAYLPARLRVAEALLKTGRTEDAAQIFNAVLARESRHPYAQLGLARIDLAARRWPAARERLLGIVAADSEFSPAWALLATVHEQLGDQPAAEEARLHSTNSGLRMMPDPWVDELMEDCYDVYLLNVAAAATARTDAPGAIRLLGRALEVDPDNPSTHRLLAEQLAKTGEAAGARREFERASQLAPGADVNWLGLIGFLNAAGDSAAAEAALDHGLVHNPDSPGLLLERVRRWSEQGRFPEVAAVLRRLKRLHPDEAEYCVKLALVDFRLGQIEAAMGEMRQALVLNPVHPIALLTLARFAIQNGDDTAARDLIARLRRQPQVQPQDLNLVLGEYRAQFNREP